jgi:hypothetical protein
MKMRLVTWWLAVALLLSLPVVAQELPSPDSLYVATRCHVNDGFTFQDAVAEARGMQSSADGPNNVFYRQPIAGNGAAGNQFVRVVSWRNMEHWASSVGAPSTETHTCDNPNRRFFTNRNVGENRGAYAGSSDRSSLVSTRRCTIERGHTIADVYRTLTGIQAAREARGDTSVMHLSHLFLGPADGTEMRSTIVIRTIGESAVGLARSLDSVMAGDVSIGTPINAPAENCQDATLTRSYIVTN